MWSTKLGQFSLRASESNCFFQRSYQFELLSLFVAGRKQAKLTLAAWRAAPPRLLRASKLRSDKWSNVVWYWWRCLKINCVFYYFLSRVCTWVWLSCLNIDRNNWDYHFSHKPIPLTTWINIIWTLFYSSREGNGRIASPDGGANWLFCCLWMERRTYLPP